MNTFNNATGLQWIDDWFDKLEPISIYDLTHDPGKAALISTDMILGFCDKGPLASERVRRLMQPVRQLFIDCHAAGVGQFVLLQDAHHPKAPEFDAWPVHCVEGTLETRTIDALRTLPFASKFVVFEKNSLSPSIGTGFDAWLGDRPEINTTIVAGNCTDLCVYQLAMYLRMRANGFNISGFRVVVPAQVVDTYDLSTENAESTGAIPHPGELYHRLFLNHMALNGIEVVSKVTTHSDGRHHAD
ncbi:cysteine hydrolase [soil metagenome]